MVLSCKTGGKRKRKEIKHVELSKPGERAGYNKEDGKIVMRKETHQKQALFDANITGKIVSAEALNIKDPSQTHSDHGPCPLVGSYR